MRCYPTVILFHRMAGFQDIFSGTKRGYWQLRGGISNLNRYAITVSMLFDLKPKEKIKDFFNYKEELGAFVGCLTNKSTRMVVIRGLRRTGKSSLLKVGLNKCGVKFVMVDARELSSPSRRSFESKLLAKLKAVKWLPAALLEKIESVDVGVRVSLRTDEGIWELLKALNPVIAVDEVQMLKGTGVEAFFAAVYDNTDCKIVLTGSEVGVLDAFVGKDNPKAALFGRGFVEIKMHPLEAERSREFLMAGFKEAGKSLPEDAIRKAVAELDGIVGWLAIFGNSALGSEPANALADSVTKGTLLAHSELQSFLGARRSAEKRYLTLLRLLAGGPMRWSVLKREMQAVLNERIADSQFSNYLKSLVAYGFVAVVGNIYEMPDPLLRRALRGGISN